MKNTANLITIGRIALIPVFMWAMLSGRPFSGSLALAVFLIASLSDLADGYIARHLNQVSNFGKFMDPLADKLLIASALFLFVENGQMASWAAMIVIAREFAVTSLRLVAMSGGKVISAGPAGKIKTCVQIACVALMLTGWRTLPVLRGATLNDAAVWLMVLVTVWSGISYFVEHRAVFFGKA